jgi:hypothetical protein
MLCKFSFFNVCSVLERFPKRRTPVVRKKAHQNKELEHRSDAIRTENALAEFVWRTRRSSAGIYSLGAQCFLPQQNNPFAALLTLRTLMLSSPSYLVPVGSFGDAA